MKVFFTKKKVLYFKESILFQSKYCKLKKVLFEYLNNYRKYFCSFTLALYEYRMKFLYGLAHFRKKLLREGQKILIFERG